LARIDSLDNLFLGIGSFDERTLFQNAGFTWNPRYKAWVTKDADAAYSIKGVRWMPAAVALLDQIDRANNASLELSYAEETEFNPPSPPGLEFFAFQKAGIEYAMFRKDTLIADQPGLGKSPTSVGVMNCLKVLRPRVLVIAPASLKENWRREVERWKTKDVTVGIAETQNKQKVADGFYKNGKAKYKTEITKEFWPETDVVIINYDIISRFLDQIKEVHWDLLVVDESHALKTKESLRTILILGGKHEKGKGKTKEVTKYYPIDAKKRLFLTGTPILNRPVELWPLVHALDGNGLGKSYTQFTERYCEAHYDYFGRLDVSGASNKKELGTIMRERFMVRRLKKNVLPDLPQKLRGVIVLDTPELRELVARESELADALKLYEKLAIADVGGEQIVDKMADFGMSEADYDENGTWSRRVNLEYASAVLGLEPPAVAILFEELAHVRRELGLAKLSGAVPWIKTVLDGGNKLLVFAYHSAVVEALREALADYNPAVIYGKTPVKKRQLQVDQFQEDETCRVFIGNIDAAGVGLTLTKASDVCFVEIDWVPAKLSQCEDRACRIGSKFEKIFVNYLVANGSLDSRIAQSSYLKEETIAEVLDT